MTWTCREAARNPQRRGTSPSTPRGPAAITTPGRMKTHPGRISASWIYNGAHPGEAPRERSSFTVRGEMSINPFDEISLEEALRLKDAASSRGHRRHGGPRTASSAAHRAGHGGIAPWHTCSRTVLSSRSLRRGRLLKLIEREQPLLFILGKQAIDYDNARPARCWRAVELAPIQPTRRRSSFSAVTARVTREGGRRARDPRGGPAGGDHHTDLR